jgi:hypothetical protein
MRQNDADAAAAQRYVDCAQAGNAGVPALMSRAGADAQRDIDAPKA